jgi:Ca2+-binding RTX toxin-like protein
MSHPVDVLCPFSPHTFNSNDWPRGPSHSRTDRERRPHTKGKGRDDMKIKNKAIGLLSTMAVVLVLGSGVALAATTIHCPNDTSQGSPSSFLYCNGTSLADTMSGSELADYMLGKGANDTMHGYAGGDSLYGDKGSDHIYGDSGSEYGLWGGAYDAGTYPDTSDDYVHGGGGDDKIRGGDAQGGVDRLYGEGGNDYIDASQRQSPNPAIAVTKEIIDCGAGASDEVYFDKGLDVVTNCEIPHPF